MRSYRGAWLQRGLPLAVVAGLLFSGVAFAGGKNCKDKEACKKENKAAASKEKSKADKEVKKEKETASSSSKA